MNGDGYSDVIVGAEYYDNGEICEGRVYVYHGSESGLSATPAWIVEGDHIEAALGHSVAPAGDVNVELWVDAIAGIGDKITWTAEDEVVARSILGLPEKSIEELQEMIDAEEERKQAFLEKMAQPRDSQDEMGATEYPTDGQRTWRERRWKKELDKFFSGQRKRIMKASRKAFKK